MGKISMTGTIKEVTEYEGQHGLMLNVRVQTGETDYTDLLEVPASDENRKKYAAGGSVTDLPVRVWALRKKDGGAWVKYTPSRNGSAA